jgi:hypothetical protein
LVEKCRLFFGVNRADGDAVHAGRNEIADDFILFRHRGTGKKTEVQIYVAQILRRAVAAVPHTGPKIVFGIGDHGQAQRFGIGVGFGLAGFPAAAQAAAQAAQSQGEKVKPFHSKANLEPFKNYCQLNVV